MSSFRNILKPIAILTGIVAVFSLHVSAVLTDPQLSSQFWPADINQLMVDAFGGSSTQTAGGTLQLQLPAWAVFLRVAVLLAIAIGLRWKWPPKHGEKAGENPAGGASRVIRSVCGSLLLAVAWWPIYLTCSAFNAEAGALIVSLLPIWTMLSLAAVSLALAMPVERSVLSAHSGSQWQPPSLLSSSLRFSFGLLLGAVVVWVGISFWMNRQLYELLLIPHGDSAMYEEHLWNLRHGKGFRSYLDQGLFLGEHFQVIHLMLLPLHVLWPSHLLLELAESVALASCSLLIFRIAMRHSQSKSVALSLAIAWLLYFPMHFLDIAVDQKTFRPICLALPFLFLLIDFAERGRVLAMSVCLLLALSAKEDIALVTAPLLAVLAVRQKFADERTVDDSGLNRRFIWIAGASVFSIVYLLFVVLIGIPAFRDGSVVHYSRYFGELGSSPGELVRNSISNPMLLLQQLFSGRTLIYAVVFLAPLGFLPLRKPALLLAGLPSFVMLSLLQFSDDRSGLPPIPYHHFHAPLLPVLFWAAAVALRPKHTDESESRTGRPSRLAAVFSYLPPFRRHAGIWILFCAAATALINSPMPFGTGFWSTQSSMGYRNLYLPDDDRKWRRAAMAEVVEQTIPMDARVAATDFIHTRLTHRKRSYDYSSYPRAVNQNQPGAPPDTDYIVIDTAHHYSEFRTLDQVREYQEHPERWEVLPDRTDGFFIILRRRAESGR